jgi:hypothetical protein
LQAQHQDAVVDRPAGDVVDCLLKRCSVPVNRRSLLGRGIPKDGGDERIQANGVGAELFILFYCNFKLGAGALLEAGTEG